MLFSVFTLLYAGVLLWVVVKHLRWILESRKELKKMHFKHAILVQTIKCISSRTVCLPLLNAEHLQNPASQIQTSTSKRDINWYRVLCYEANTWKDHVTSSARWTNSFHFTRSNPFSFTGPTSPRARDLQAILCQTSPDKAGQLYDSWALKTLTNWIPVRQKVRARLR